MKNSTKLVYFICSVRNATKEESEYNNNYVASVENLGNKVHYPPRDVNQVDPIGLRILSEHKEAMKKADFVHANWNQNSNGSYFDFGMAFMNKKIPWHIINHEKIKVNELDEFQSFIMMHALMGNPMITSRTYEIDETLDDFKYWILTQDKILYSYPEKGLDQRSLFELGMMFISEKPFIVKNKDYLETQRTPDKSFQNVLLELDNFYRPLLEL